MGSIRDRVKAFDKATGGLIMTAYRLGIRVVDFPSLLKIRMQVKKEVGRNSYCKIKKLRVVSFPNELKPANHLLEPGYVLQKILRVCGQRPSQFCPWKPFDVLINWQDLTKNPIDTKSYVKQSLEYANASLSCRETVAVNLFCGNIEKSLLGTINKEVFGYRLDVNPIRYRGAAVRKANENGRHDGIIIECPIMEEKFDRNSVYNVLIDNTKNGFAIDYRVIFMNGIVNFFYEKRRPIVDRFSNTNTSVKIREISDEFTSEEISGIEQVCTKLSADYGEVDVLRDRGSGRIYVVDFAKTPAGPPNGLVKSDVKSAIKLMSIAYINNICRTSQ